MNKSLGEYVRLIPREDQDTMVVALLPKRTGFHRGMLAFVPIEELKLALRPKPAIPDAQMAQQLQMAKMQVRLAQQQQAAKNQWNTLYGQGLNQYPTQGLNQYPTTTTTTSTTGVGISGTYYPNTLGGGYVGTTIPTPTQEVPQTYLFAYAALLAAINAMPGALDYHEPAEEPQLESCEA